MKYTWLERFFEESIRSFLISLINLLDLKDKPTLCTILNRNVRIVVKKILQWLLLFNAWFAVKWLFRQIRISFHKVFYFLYCFAITLGWFFLFVFNFLCAFSLNCFVAWFVLYFKWLCTLCLTEVGNFYCRVIIGHCFLNCVFSAYRFVSWI